VDVTVRFEDERGEMEAHKKRPKKGYAGVRSVFLSLVWASAAD